MQKLLDTLVAAAPRAALVVLVLLLGLVLSAVARRVVRWLTRKSGLEAFAEKAGVAPPLYAMGAKDGIAELLGQVAWAAGMLLTLSAVADLLQLQAVSAVTSLAVQFLPRLLAAATVLLGGLAVAALVRNVLTAVGRKRADVDAPDVVAQLAYYVIVTVTITLAADQAGLQTGIVENLLLVVVGISLAGVALSFALGARGIFRNLTARHYYEKLVHPGDHIRVGDHVGVVVHFSPMAVTLRTERGRRVILPCGDLLDRAVEIEPLEPAVGSDHPVDSTRPPDAPDSAE